MNQVSQYARVSMKSLRLVTTILAAALVLTGCSGDDRAAECREQGKIFVDQERSQQERLDAGERIQELDCYKDGGKTNY